VCSSDLNEAKRTKGKEFKCDKCIKKLKWETREKKLNDEVIMMIHQGKSVDEIREYFVHERSECDAIYMTVKRLERIQKQVIGSKGHKEE
jgi:hypothetical protein